MRAVMAAASNKAQDKYFCLGGLWGCTLALLEVMCCDSTAAQYTRGGEKGEGGRERPRREEKAGTRHSQMETASAIITCLVRSSTFASYTPQ